MFEKIKAWIKRKRETAREQQAADRLIKHIEQALGFELYEWQRLYIITGIWQPPEGRLHGRTTAYILRLLLFRHCRRYSRRTDGNGNNRDNGKRGKYNNRGFG